MLIGIPALIGPELLDTLYRMGHGDELLLADAFFPGHSTHVRVMRLDGVPLAPLLDAILGLVNIDVLSPNPLAMMAPSPGDSLDATVEARYRAIIDRRWPGLPPVERLERGAFYDRARKAFAVVMTGETAAYGNLIIRKGVVPCR